MATKKKAPLAPTTNGEPAPAPTEKEPKPSRMTKLQLQRRIHALEAQVATLTTELEEARGPEVPWWRKIVGSHADALGLSKRRCASAGSSGSRSDRSRGDGKPKPPVVIPEGWHAHVPVGMDELETHPANPCPRGRGHATLGLRCDPIMIRPT
jgi:hypothetical protein